ncbi:NUDIX domain-containing protein [Micromonospora citrea]|uniref:NUDIX domain-containing protein n=1 Tax=Micromonospora citrea TaxID=47855 RepID=A0A1C6VTD2_9ACTN|nr:NUDIX domain-containing protein [Micromonospora citrea]SCL69437.1 NUDIX domain-containing protein [Micromonospora citrea]
MGALTWAVAAVVTDDAGRVLLCRQGRGERRHALPGGRLRPAESPAQAVVRDIRAETGWDVEVVDLVGLYHLAAPCPRPPAAASPPAARTTSPPTPDATFPPTPDIPAGLAASSAGRAGPLPDVLVHVFRARVLGAGPTGDPMGGCRVSWHDVAALPEALTPTTRAALADALAGRSGVLRAPQSPDATTSAGTPPTPDTAASADAPDTVTSTDRPQSPDATTRTHPPPPTTPRATPAPPPGQRAEPSTDRVPRP